MRSLAAGPFLGALVARLRGTNDGVESGRSAFAAILLRGFPIRRGDRAVGHHRENRVERPWQPPREFEHLRQHRSNSRTTTLIASRMPVRGNVRNGVVSCWSGFLLEEIRATGPLVL